MRPTIFTDELASDICRRLSLGDSARQICIDSRKWKVARMSPRKYGDKQQIDHTSSDDSFKPTVIKLVAEPFPDSDD